jgi:ligand-binding sensor domain-containing protein
LAHNKITALFADGSDLWIAFDAGLQKLNGITWTNYSTASGLVCDTVKCFARNGSSVFIGTQNGISEYNAGVWTSHTIGAPGTDDNSVFSMGNDGLIPVRLRYIR